MIPSSPPPPPLPPSSSSPPHLHSVLPPIEQLDSPDVVQHWVIHIIHNVVCHDGRQVWPLKKQNHRNIESFVLSPHWKALPIDNAVTMDYSNAFQSDSFPQS